MGLIDDTDEITEIDEQIVANDTARDEYIVATTALMAAWRQAMDKWVDSDQQEAIRTGQPPRRPKPVPPIDNDERGHAIASFAAEAQRLRDVRDQTLATVAPRVEKQAEEALADLTGKVQTIIGQVEPLAAEVNDLLAAVHQVRLAQYRQRVATGTGAVQPTAPIGFDAATLVDTVRHGRSLVTAPERRLGFTTNPWTDAPAREITPQPQAPVSYPLEPVATGPLITNRGRQI